MDWQRAKTILIIAFVIVNLFLLFQIQETMQQKIEYLAVDKITDSQMKSLLTENRIQLLVPRPKDVDELKIWQGSLSEMANWQELKHGYQKRFTNNTIPVQNENQLRAFLETQIPFFAEYRLQTRPKKMQGKWIYIQQIDNRPLFDGKLEVQVEGKQLRSLYIVHYQIQDTPKVVAINDFNSALYNLINYASKSRVQHIRKVQLGYQAQVYNDRTYFFIPVWRFQLDNKWYDVHAIRFGAVKSVEVVKNGS